jgi:amidohydrolase
LETLKEIRQHLHRFPELSGQEYETQRYLKTHLEDLDHAYFKEVGVTGLLIGFYSKQPGATILLRADIDALPITEINNFAHRSLKEKESHKCGHDGHTAIMVGVARHFSKNQPKQGKVFLLFQPAEETGAGAKAVMNDEEFRKLSFDSCFALHNLPGFPKHQIISKAQQFSAGAISVAYRFFGRTAHAAQPETGQNPAIAIGDVLKLSETFSNPILASEEFALVTPIYATLGEKYYGIAPGYGEVHFTLRAWSLEQLKLLQEKLSLAIKAIADGQNLLVEEEWFEEFYNNHNDQKAFEAIKQSAVDLSYNFNQIEKPFRWTEDFGLFSSIFGGAMFGLGAGENTPALHSPDYDFPDETIETGVAMFVKICENYP